MAPTQRKQAPSPYHFLDIHDEVIQGLVHFTRQPEHHILSLGFPREQGYHIRSYQESPPKDNSKTLFDEKMDLSEYSDMDADSDDDGRGGYMIEVWRVDEYYHPTSAQWVTTNNSLIFILLCHASVYDVVEFPACRIYNSKVEKKPPTVIEVDTSLQVRLQNKCQKLVDSTPSQMGVSAGIACGSGVRFFKWKVAEPDLLFGHVYWHIDLGSGCPSVSAKAAETFIEATKEMTSRGKV